MVLKKELFVRAVVGAVAIAGSYFGVINPLANWENTRRIAWAFVPPGHRISCAEDVLPASTTRPYDAIGVFGAGKVINHDGETEPNAAGKMRLRAAAQARQAGLADKIVLVGDAAAWTQDGLMSLGQKFLRDSWDVPSGDVIAATGLVGNTATDAAQLAREANINGLRRIRLVDSSAHGNRSAILSCQEGVAVDWMSIDDDTGDFLESLKLAWMVFDNRYLLATTIRLSTLSQ